MFAEMLQFIRLSNTAVEAGRHSGRSWSDGVMKIVKFHFRVKIFKKKK